MADVQANGIGLRHLIQHSGSSQKSNFIACLAHQLMGLEKNSHPMVDSVLVVPDRRIGDNQIRDSIKQLMQVSNTVAWADHSVTCGIPFGRASASSVRPTKRTYLRHYRRGAFRAKRQKLCPDEPGPVRLCLRQ